MQIDASALISGRMSTTDDAKTLIDFLRAIKAVTPDYCGQYPPLRMRFAPENDAQLIENWGRAFAWKRRNQKQEGAVTFPLGTRQVNHSMVSAHSLEADLAVPFTELVKAIASRFRCDFGYVHFTTDHDKWALEHTETVVMTNPARDTYMLIVTTNELRRYIPDLYWFNVFGKPYVDLFGREKLRSAPAYKVEEIAPDCYSLQLTPDANDILTDYSTFESIRTGVKQHLNPNAFFQIELGTEHAYDVPEFLRLISSRSLLP